MLSNSVLHGKTPLKMLRQFPASYVVRVLHITMHHARMTGIVPLMTPLSGQASVKGLNHVNTMQKKYESNIRSIQKNQGMFTNCNVEERRQKQNLTTFCENNNGESNR